jgi:hypothetical protein
MIQVFTGDEVLSRLCLLVCSAAFFAEKLQFELVKMVTARRGAGRTREDI